MGVDCTFIYEDGRYATDVFGDDVHNFSCAISRVVNNIAFHTTRVKCYSLIEKYTNVYLPDKYECADNIWNTGEILEMESNVKRYMTENSSDSDAQALSFFLEFLIAKNITMFIC